jgi:nitrite reductase/ring-hydroxylating ferredoxin subunit
MATSRPSPPWAAIPAALPPAVVQPGTDRPRFIGAGRTADLPEGSMWRVTDGELEGCVVACPLHEGQFDLCSGDPVRMPTTGGLDPDGVYHPTWSPAGKDPKIDPPGKKAEARKLTRVRRFRYYPVRITDDTIEVGVPRAPNDGSRD